MIAPALKKGGVIGLCAPCQLPAPERYAPVLDALRRRGFTVREAENLYKDTDGYLATPQERAADFNQLIHDPQVEVIFFGGGECGNELWPYIDYEYLKAHPKRVAGFSDGTYLVDAVWARTGIVTYYGPTPGMFSDLRAYDWESFAAHLMGDAPCHVQDSPWRMQHPGTAEGVLIGGYARNIALMTGCAFFPPDKKEKYVLFLEDHEKFGGPAYVSSLLSWVEQSPLMPQVTGLIFGHYSVNVPDSLLARLTRFGRENGIPVIYTDDFGHGTRHAVLDVGRQVRMDENGMKYL